MSFCRFLLLIISPFFLLSGVRTNFSFDCVEGPYCPGVDVQVTCKTMNPFLELKVKFPSLQIIELDFHGGNAIGRLETGNLANSSFTAKLLNNSLSCFVANLSYNTQNISMNSTVSCVDGFNANSRTCSILLHSAPDRVVNLRYDNNTGILSWKAPQTSIPIKYKITVVPPPVTGNTYFATNNTWINITNLNASHAVTVVANNCAGDGEKSVYTVNFPKPGLEQTVTRSFQQTSTKPIPSKSSSILQIPSSFPTITPTFPGLVTTGATVGIILVIVFLLMCSIIGIITIICLLYHWHHKKKRLNLWKIANVLMNYED